MIEHLSRLQNIGALDTKTIADTFRQSLLIAQQKQSDSLYIEKKVDGVSTTASPNPPVIPIEPPNALSSSDGAGREASDDFFESMIIALSRLGEVLERKADLTLTELQGLQHQAKNLLKEKIRSIEENEERRLAHIAAKADIEEHKKSSGIFGNVLGFLLAGAQIIGGLMIAAAGFVAGNPALIAGGACLVVSGTLDVTVQVLKVKGGNEQTISALTTASTSLLAAGVLLCSFGTAGVVAVAANGLKKASSKVLPTASSGIKTAGKEGAEQSAKSTAKDADEILKKALEDNPLLKNSIRGFSLVSGGTGIAVNSYNIHRAGILHGYEERKADLDQEIEELQAELDATIQKQEFINKLIEALREHWARAVISPVDDALNVLNGAIQDRRIASTRIASSFSV